MNYFTGTTDKLQLARSTAATLDVKVSWIEIEKATGDWVDADTTPTAFSSAATGDIMTAAGSGNFRSVKELTIMNKDASLACTISLILDRSATDYVIGTWTLNAGDQLYYIEGLGYFVSKPNTTRSGLKNVSTTDQSLTAAAANYLTGSAILLPASPLLVAGMTLRWTLHYSRTAGTATAAAALAILFGTNGSTSDTSRCATGNLDTETAVADEMVAVITAIIRGPIGASCIVQSSWMFNNNLTTTGFSNTARKAQIKRVQSSAFDITPAGTIAGLTMTPGTSNVVTMNQVTAELLYTGG